MGAFRDTYGEGYIRNVIGAFTGCQPGGLCSFCVSHLDSIFEESLKQIESCFAGTDKMIGYAALASLFLTTWNIAGLFCRDIFKYKAKESQAHRQTSR